MSWRHRLAWAAAIALGVGIYASAVVGIGAIAAPMGRWLAGER